MSKVRYDEAGNPVTYVPKADLPSQETIAKNILLVKSRHTVASKMKALMEAGYLIDNGTEYILPRKEEFYMLLPLPLLQHLIYVVKESVIKTLIYLCYCYNRQEQSIKAGGTGYSFTLREVAENIGIDYHHNSSAVNSYVTVLEQMGIVRVVRFYDGPYPKMRITALDFSVPSQLLNKS